MERPFRDAGQLDQKLYQVMRTVRRLGNSVAHSIDGERCDTLRAEAGVAAGDLVSQGGEARSGHARWAFRSAAPPADADEPLRDELQELRERLTEREEELQRIWDEDVPRLKQRLEEALQTADAAQLNEQAALELAEEAEAAAQADREALERQLQELDVAGAIEQAKRYSRGVGVERGDVSPGDPWDDFRVPFPLASLARHEALNGILAAARVRLVCCLSDAGCLTSAPAAIFCRIACTARHACYIPPPPGRYLSASQRVVLLCSDFRRFRRTGGMITSRRLCASAR